MDAINFTTSKSTGLPVEFADILAKLKTNNISDYVIIVILCVIFWFQIFYVKKFPKKKQQQQQQHKFHRKHVCSLEGLDLIDGNLINDSEQIQPATDMHKIEIQKADVI
jgi:hypothetical protein